MIPPAGFEAEQYPLIHHQIHAAGLSAVTTTKNTVIFPIIRNFIGVNAGDTIDVNPHHASFDKETGTMCAPMSIIDRLVMNLKFSLTKTALLKVTALRCWWQPIIFSFPEKLDATDEFSSVTVETALAILHENTQQDVTPLYNNVKTSILGTSDRTVPMSTVNSTESFGTMNLDTDTTQEAVTYDDSIVKDLLKHGTNKGALKACLGRRRYVTLTERFPNKSFFINKPVPRQVRRIVDASTMMIMVHVPTAAEEGQIFQEGDLTADIAYIGCQLTVGYHEWNPEHHQDMVG